MPSKSRDAFLIAMYEQMWNNINRHITLSWQPIAALAVVVAATNSALQGSVPYGLAVSAGLAVLFWFLAHIYDANGWYHRNHLIVANLEGYFSERGDDKRLNPFMGKLLSPRRKLKGTDMNVVRMLTVLRIHWAFAIVLALLLVALLVSQETMPFLRTGTAPVLQGAEHKWIAVAPFAVLFGGLSWIGYVRRNRLKQYTDAYALALRGRRSAGVALTVDEKKFIGGARGRSR